MNEQNQTHYSSNGGAAPGGPDTSSWAKNFSEFWPIYLSQHSNQKTRLWHYAGTIAGICAGFFVLGKTWSGSSLVEAVILAIFTLAVVSYGLLFVSHWVIEGNQPATLQAFGKSKGQIVKELWWSVRGDFKMLWLALNEGVTEEYRKYSL